MARHRRTMPKPAGYHWSQAEPVLIAGKPSCRWCCGKLPKRKRTFCSEACVLEWRRRTTWSITRRLVFDRDLGRCQACQLDCRDLEVTRLTSGLQRAIARAAGGTVRPDPNEVLADAASWSTALTRAITWRVRHRVPLDHGAWEVDHVEPVSLGGDWFDMGNLACLCVPCHRAKTARDAERAKLAGVRLTARRDRPSPKPAA
jgi:5-methylcytosine-specific restriction protein A